MNKEKFKIMFDECMSYDKVWCGSYEQGNDSYAEITPKMTIRNFEVDMPKLSDADFNETFNINDCDTDFTDFEKAWNYFQTLSVYRIMAGNGIILLDNYCGDC